MRISLSAFALVVFLFLMLVAAPDATAANKPVVRAAGAAKGPTPTATPKIPHVSQSTGPIQDKWAIVIGINTFADKRIPTLKYAAKDAEDFARFLVDKENFARDHVLLLTNENATEDSILDAIGDNWLPRRAFPDDLVLVYVSSHGSPSEVDVAGENFLVAHDTKVDRLFSSGIRLEDLAPTIKKRTGCGRIVLILDACNSGAADVTSKGLYRSQNFDLSSLAGEGLIVISSSQADQRSWESARYANGVFTKRLMESLQANGNTTTLSQAFGLLENSVQEEVRFDRKAFQKPLMKSKWVGQELALGVTPARPRKLSKELAEGEVTTPDTVPASTDASIASIGIPSNLPPPVQSTPAAPPKSPSGQRPWLGVMLIPMSPQVATELRLPQTVTGALIREIVPGSGAANSGLRVGDIIQTVNGTAISRIEDIQKITGEHKVGDALGVNVYRDGATVAIGVVLAAQPPMPDPPVATAGGGASGPLAMETPTFPVPGQPSNSGDSVLQATVARNVHALPDKIAILPFAAPQNFELTKTPDYPRNFTTEDRTRVATLPLLMWQAVVRDLTSQMPNISVLSPDAVRDAVMRNQGLQLDPKNTMATSNKLGAAMGARYVVITQVQKFSFAGRVAWSNEYNIKLVTHILDCQKGQIIATIPKTVTKTPWLGDSNLWFTDYLERMILPEFCKKMAQDIARKLPQK